MEEHLGQGAPMKNWEYLGPHQKRRLSQKALDEVKRAAAARNVAPEKIAGAVLHRLVYQTDKRLAETAKKIEEGESVQPRQTVSICHGIWLVTMGGGFGKKQYRAVKSSLKELVTFPSWEVLSNYWKENILVEPEFLWKGEPRQLCGVVMDPFKFIPMYLVRFLERRSMEDDLPQAGNYKIKMKVGSDGGRHGWYKWSEGPVPTGSSMTHSITLYDCMLLSMRNMVGTPEYFWDEPKPCSDKVTRVLGVIMADEGEQLLERAIIWLQGQQQKLVEGFSVQYSGQEYTFVVEFIDRTDKKMDRLLTGVGDGCDSCLVPRAMWTDEMTIAEGFPKNRTLENMRETWEALRKNKDGTVFKQTGDYATRLGLCREPVTLRDTLTFTITHKWMILIDHKMKILYHLMIGHFNWIEDASVKAEIAAAKKVVQDVLKPAKVHGGSAEENIGIAYSYPDAKGLGGNTTTAGVARKFFFSEVLRQRVVDLCPMLFREAMKKILFNDLILLRLMSCDYTLLPDKIGMDC